MLEIVTTRAGVRGLQDDWLRLAAHAESPLLDYPWFDACASTLYDESALHVIVVRAGGRVTAIAPLVRTRRSRTEWLEIMGGAILHEPAGLLAEDDAALDELLDGLARSGYPVELSRLPLLSGVVRRLAQSSPPRMSALVRRTAGACYVDLHGDWPAFEGAMRTRARKNLRTTRRRAEGLGPVTIEAYPAAAGTLSADLDRAMRIEAASWKGRRGSALLHQPRLRRFFEAYAERSCRDGRLRLFYYLVGGRAVAMRIAVEHARRLWFLKEGYDEEFAVLSPGIQLTHETLRWATEQRLAGCEFLGSAEAWQQNWPVEVRAYCTVVLYPWSLRGALGTLDTALTYASTRLARRARRAAPAATPED